MTEQMKDQIIELQTKVQFQEDALQEMDQVLVRQADVIDRLIRRVRELEDKVEQALYERSGAQSMKDEKPPHY